MPLRLVHTSDWHLGHVLHDVDQEPEQRAFLAWLADLCVEERADALLVSGDLFDVSNPPASAVSLFAGFLIGLWHRLPRFQVIAIGGNHDSAHRLETTEPFLDALGRLHVLGGVPRRQGALDLDRLLVRVEGESGSALIAAIPFLRAADLRAEELGGDPAVPVRRLHDEVFAAARARLRPGEALVAMGHVFVAGGASVSSERTLVGGVGAVPPDVFPQDVAYAALGHLHRPQVVDGRLHYPGAPVPLSFDESEHRQQALVVELDEGRLASVRPVETPRTRPLLRVPADGPAPLEEVVRQLRALPAAGDIPADRLPLLEARVLLDRPEPQLRAELEKALAGRAARLVTWKSTFAGTGAALADVVPGRELSEFDPIEVFRRRWDRRHGGEPPADLLGAFGELLEVARGEVGAVARADGGGTP